MKRILCIMLALLMLLSFAACKKSGDDQTDSAESVNAETENEAWARLGNTQFNDSYDILTRKSSAYEVTSESGEGSLVAEAVYRRNSELSDRFAVTINVHEEEGDYNVKETFIQKVESTFMAGTHDYDMVMTHSGYATTLALRGYAYDLNKLPKIDLDAEWWCQGYMDNADVDGRKFLAMGDLGYTLYEYMECVFFNKTIVEKYDLPDLYELANEGGWTYSKLLEFAKLVEDDADGNGVYDENDTFGLGINNHACRLAVTTWDLALTVKDSNGKHVLNVSNNKLIDAYDKLYSLVYENNKNVFFIQDKATNNDRVDMFVGDQLMFYIETFYHTTDMHDMVSDYGILPYPKYDENQADYISAARDAVTAYIVMSDITNPEMVGTITEAMCLKASEIITPAYYETTLKYRAFSDPIAMSMLDTIRDTMTYDFASVYVYPLNYMSTLIGDSIEKGNKNISSFIRLNTGVWESSLDNLYSEYSKVQK